MSAHSIGTDTTPLRVMLTALCCEKGDWETNLARHRELLRQARDADCHLVAFPEMSLSGSVNPRSDPGSLLRLDSAPVQALIESTQEYSVAAVFGIAEESMDSGASHITQAYACHGRLAGVHRKRHLGEGEEAYTTGTEQGVFRYGALSLGIAICAEGGVDYAFDEPVAAGAELIVFCAAPGLHGRRTTEAGWRAGHTWWESCGLQQAYRHARRTGAWVALSTQAGATTDEDFPGLAALVAPNGEVVARLPDWREGSLVVDVPVSIDVEPAREAARVLVVDEGGRALLVRFSDELGHNWWTTPGGGLEPGEDHLAAARRELSEELGRDDLPIGAQLGGRRHTLCFAGGPWMTQSERWFLARCPAFEVPAERVALLASEGVTEIRWWSGEDLARSGVVTAPRRLAGLVTEVASGRLPPPETDLGL